MGGSLTLISGEPGIGKSTMIMQAAACMIMVDLPMPGSPEISVREPPTRPPPRTRFSSPMPVSIL